MNAFAFQARANAPSSADISRWVAAYDAGNIPLAVSLGEGLAKRFPAVMVSHNLLGVAWLAAGQPGLAEAAFRQAAAIDGQHPAIFNNLGMALAAQGRHADAIAAYRTACQLDPAHASARSNLGNSLKAVDRLEEAVASYREALRIQPAFADAWCNLGIALHAQSRWEEAVAAYGKAFEAQPEHAGAFNNLGNLLADCGLPADARNAYRQALGLKPAFAEAWLNLALLDKREKDYAGAHAALDRAVAIEPGNARLLLERGKLLAVENRLDEAIACFAQTLALDPALDAARMLKLYHQIQICDWTAFEEFARLDGEGTIPEGAISPFTMLAFQDDPVRQLRRSQAWAQARFKSLPLPPLPARPVDRAGRPIRVGYFSADFHEHATMYLLAGLLREHDPDRFEIHAFSYGDMPDDPMRQSAMARVRHFTDISSLTDIDAVALARSHELDIAVDLKGYTRGSRTTLFASRLAPVQIGYLGYPGSSGAPFIDYLVADAVVVPPELHAAYAEKLIVMPACYQANDDQRPIAPDPLSRADHGLPRDGFVFCCFNQNYKVGPAEFAGWLRLLGQVPDSVLWLLRSNRWAEDNFRRHAAVAGIDPARLVFADLLPHSQHLARLRHADLFLDTFNVNAHTTASDALWATLPLVTRVGRQFAARVSASLLSAVGLGELACESATEYEALALALATDRPRLAAIRARLEQNRHTMPLFDTALYSRQLERGYALALDRYHAGLAPAHIFV